MAYCFSGTMVKWAGGKATAHPLRCKSWSCAQCAPWRAKMLINEAIAGKPTTFITLTSNPATGTSPADRAQALVEAWRIILRKIKKMPGSANAQYLVVIEKTQRGEPHLHILARCGRVSQKWLSDQCRELLDAPIVDIRRITGKRGAAQYVSKYIGKDPARFEGCKRYWRSLDYMHPTRAELRANRDPDTVFYLVPMHFTKYRDILKSTGWNVTRDWPLSTEVDVPPWEAAPPLCNAL